MLPWLLRKGSDKKRVTHDDLVRAMSGLSLSAEPTVKVYSPTTKAIEQANRRMLEIGMARDIKENLHTSKVIDQLGRSCNVLTPLLFSRSKGVKASAESIRWLEYMQARDGDTIWHSKNGGEVTFTIGLGDRDRRYSVDGYCPSTMTIYEFNGDHWHANPLLLPLDSAWDKETLVCEKYDKQETKTAFLMLFGFRVISTTELEWNEIKRRQRREVRTAKRTATSEPVTISGGKPVGATDFAALRDTIVQNSVMVPLADRIKDDLASLYDIQTVTTELRSKFADTRLVTQYHFLRDITNDSTIAQSITRILESGSERRVPYSFNTSTSRDWMTLYEYAKCQEIACALIGTFSSNTLINKRWIPIIVSRQSIEKKFVGIIHKYANEEKELLIKLFGLKTSTKVFDPSDTTPAPTTRSGTREPVEHTCTFNDCTQFVRGIIKRTYGMNLKLSGTGDKAICTLIEPEHFKWVGGRYMPNV